ncbi:MAG: M1 family aminopeptidase, partial [Bdellovibrionales bacterium]|nr:M1 family aminopeptidase [Bdellovibrionales bacterium]
MKYLIHFGLCLFLASCSFFKQESVGRKDESGLTQVYAMLRSQSIDKVTYDLKFDLTNEKLYRGETKINFILKNEIPLSVDFAQGMIDQVYVNGKIIKHEPYNGHFINIPGDSVKLGQNTIDIKYSHEYSKNGAGFYRYIDVEDNKTYIYSHFEPYSANQLFPCFDQPDLKATYTTQVKAPKDWEVISSMRETEKTVHGDYADWTFPKTAKFSTYTYSLHAGDYHVWESIAKTKKHEIPLRLFARQSLAKYVKADEWFTLTQQAFPYFEDLYGYPYPYVKYDQLIVPDFNAGAMENVAAVTFNEDHYVRRGEKTRSQRRRLASTLFHEMAHMWFGNLVTMKWWDDLWLNESFATYSATRALVEVSEFKESWLTFNIYKQSAYKADQAVTTHPITTVVKSTDEAFANFDSITYGKGASVLKQMAFYMGDGKYKKGLRTYFKRHAEGNTVLSDFMQAMESASQKDMSQWRERWLETA